MYLIKYPLAEVTQMHCSNITDCIKIDDVIMLQMFIPQMFIILHYFMKHIKHTTRYIGTYYSIFKYGV